MFLWVDVFDSSTLILWVVNQLSSTSALLDWRVRAMALLFVILQAVMPKSTRLAYGNFKFPCNDSKCPACRHWLSVNNNASVKSKVPAGSTQCSPWATRCLRATGAPPLFSWRRLHQRHRKQSIITVRIAMISSNLTHIPWTEVTCCKMHQRPSFLTCFFSHVSISAKYMSAHSSVATPNS